MAVFTDNCNLINAHNGISNVFVEPLIGYRCYVNAYDKQAGSRLALSPKYFYASKTETRTFHRIAFKADYLLLVQLNAVILTAVLEIKIAAIGISGQEYVIATEERPLSDYRYDKGPSSTTVSIDSDSTIVDYIGSDFTLETYESVMQTKYNGGSFEYRVNPMFYKYMGIDRFLFADGNTMRVISKQLIIKSNSATLVVGAVQA